MPRNGSGQYSAPTNSWNLAVNGTLASSGDWQQILDDLAASLTQSVSRDGQSPLTGNLDLGNNKINNLSAGTGTGQALAFQQLFDQGVMQDIASAATTDIGAQNTNFLRVTGVTTITSFGTNYKGPRFLVFEGAVTLTNSSTLVLPGGANITTAAGDVLIAIPGATLGTADKWIVTAYQRNTNVNIKLTQGTAVATTSGTAIDFTGIPSWVKRITVMFNGVSTNGTSVTQIQLGAGSITTSGYSATASQFVDAGAVSVVIIGSGFPCLTTNSAGYNLHGNIQICNISGNIWVANGTLAMTTTSRSSFLAGSVSLSGTLDRLRITTVNGTDAFDAGTVNILYEG
jgi:hypothetical protein